MTNLEKYKDEIINIDEEKGGFCDFVKKHILQRFGYECNCSCDVISCEKCTMLQFIWLQEEYKEPEDPEVDWTKVEVDTPIYVRGAGDIKWFPRHFAEYKNGEVYAWRNGNTSHTEKVCFPYSYAKLSEGRVDNNE